MPISRNHRPHRLSTSCTDGRIGEIFRPLSSRFTAPLDIRLNYSPLVLTPAHRPPPPRIAELIGDNKICKEIRTYLAWMDDAHVRYGKEVVYFAVLNAGNYNYIMEWTFRDDETIPARAGSTGRQLSIGVGHMHNFTWRLDVDLNGPGDDSVYFTRHVENLTPPSTAMDDLLLIQIEGEAGCGTQSASTRWKSSTGHCRTAMGVLHLMNRYLCAAAARAIVRTLQGKTFGSRGSAELPRNSWRTICLTTLPISNQRSMRILLFGTRGSVHHEDNERDEDDNTTPVNWTGFELRPKNLFDRTPFFTP